ncbi:hypothetical protein [Streptomyces sp. B6B3]|uniref:hypothetical protein n=1 Tax=Streptomyces sp. B6B3 TaxID=3153570 RepID=UPI00325E1373
MADEETGQESADLPDDGPDDGGDIGQDSRGDDRQDEEAGRRRWPVVTAVAVAVTAIAGGLYGVQGLTGSDGAADAAEPLVLDEYAVELDAAGDEAASSDSLGYAGYAQTLSAAGVLPDGPERAAEHGFDGEVPRDRVAGLAAALGLDGPVTESGGSWTVAGTEPDAPMLTVSQEAPGFWWLGSATAAGAAEGEGSSAELSVETDGDSTVSPYDPEEPTSDGDADTGMVMPEPPSAEEALAAAEPLITELGLADARTDTSSAGSDRLVRVVPLVDGLPVSGLETYVTVGTNGAVGSAAGTLLQPTGEGTERDVIGAREALDAYNAHATEDSILREPQCADAIEPAPMPQPETEVETGESGAGASTESTESGESAEGSGAAPDAGGGSDSDAGDGTDPMPPVDGGETGEDLCAEAPKPEPTEVTVEFGLALHSSDGESLLVPSWLFSAADDATGYYLASQPAVPFEYATESDDAGDDTGDGAAVDVSEAEERAEPQESGAEDGAVGQEQPGDEGGAEVELPVDGMAIESYAAEGETLTVRFWAGVCDEYTATAEESGDEIVVRVTAENADPDRECILIAEERTAEVRLDGPVGDRVVVDAQGAEVPVR